jgi:eukaryotic-like serine/threonine-protein kinase
MGAVGAGVHTGETLGSYQLEELVGTGAAAEVYRARDQLLGRAVAVKVLRPVLSADREFIRRFRGEARRIAAVRHPHIMPVYQYGEERGYLYLVMPLLPGGSLRERLQRGPLAPPEAIRITRQIAAALDAAHAAQLLHRDVKPENILFDAQEQALLTDFGLARALPPPPKPGEIWSRVNTLGVFGIPVGTPAYMAPEQFDLWAPLDQRVDIYALGVVLYEMLTGRVPFTGTSLELAEQASARVCPPPSVQASVVWPALDACVLQALSVAPDQRYRTAADFAHALAQASRSPLPPATERTPDAPFPGPAAHAQPGAEPRAFHRLGGARSSIRRGGLVVAGALLLLCAGSGLLVRLIQDVGRSSTPAVLVGPSPAVSTATATLAPAAMTAPAQFGSPGPSSTASPPSSTRTPTPSPPGATPSPTPPTTVDLRGRIASVSSATQTFVLRSGATSTTIQVTSTTQYSGTATSFSQLQPGWHAEVHGQPSGASVMATDVNANPT